MRVSSVFYLSVGDNTDNRSILLHLLKLQLDFLLASISVVLEGILGESLLLALIPVLIESSLNLVAQVLSPDGSKGTETSRSFDVTN